MQSAHVCDKQLMTKSWLMDYGVWVPALKYLKEICNTPYFSKRELLQSFIKKTAFSKSSILYKFVVKKKAITSEKR